MKQPYPVLLLSGKAPAWEWSRPQVNPSRHGDGNAATEGGPWRENRIYNYSVSTGKRGPDHVERQKP